MCTHPISLPRDWLDFKTKKSIAWLDFCSMANCSDCAAVSKTPMEDGEVEVSYSLLAKRWETNKGMVQSWMNEWLKQGRIVRLSNPSSTGVPSSYQVVEFSPDKKPSLFAV